MEWRYRPQASSFPWLFWNESRPALRRMLLSSCCDEREGPARLVSEQIKGTWVTVSQEKAYYDGVGRLFYEETDNPGTTFFFDSSKVIPTYTSGGGMSGTYTISEGDGRCEACAAFIQQVF